MDEDRWKKAPTFTYASALGRALKLKLKLHTPNAEQLPPEIAKQLGKLRERESSGDKPKDDTHQPGR